MNTNTRIGIGLMLVAITCTQVPRLVSENIIVLIVSLFLMIVGFATLAFAESEE